MPSLSAVTHRRPDARPEDDEKFVFVTNGIEVAVAKAQELAGDKNVAVNGGQMARQCLEAGPRSASSWCRSCWEGVRRCSPSSGARRCSLRARRGSRAPASPMCVASARCGDL